MFSFCVEEQKGLVYGAPFVKILYLTDLAQKLLSLAEIAISACRDVISGRDSYLCVQRCYWSSANTVSVMCADV